MKLGIYIIISIFICFSSCKEQIKTIDNKFVDVIVPETYAKLLAESQLIEAHTTVLRINQPYYKDSVANYYAALFNKYNVTSDAFYYSMKAYSYRPDELHEIYNLAITHLENIEAGLVDELIISRPIATISRQQVGDIVMQTPYMSSLLNDSTNQLPFIQDSIFTYVTENDSIVTLSNTNIPSFQYSFIVNSHQLPMYMNLKSYIRSKLEKNNGID